MALTTQDKVARPQLAAIPEELKTYDHWLLWKAEPDGKNPGVLTKKPKNLYGNSLSGWQHTENLYSFEEVTSALKSGKFDGIGFSPKNTPFVCIDLDNDRSIDNIPDELMQIMNEGYAEISPSKRGIHVWMQADVPEGTGKKRTTASGDEIELFSNTGWLTMTGDRLNPMDIEPKQFVIDGIISRYGFIKQATPAPERQLQTYTPSTDLSESELIEKMLASKDGDMIKRLLDGDTSLHNDDDSDADLALCGKLAFWTNKDAALMDSIFRTSGLYRNKWDEKRGNSTYGWNTIKEAISNQEDGYTGPKKKNEPVIHESKQIPNPVESQAEKEVESMDLSKKTLNDLTPAQINALTEEQQKELYLKTNAKSYVQNFIDGVTASIDTPAIPTGFDKTDSILDGGLYEGLYIIGAISSLGKTTVSMQIADQIAQQGQDVIIFSLEMARSEIMAKSISRLSLLRTLETGLPDSYAKTARGITAGKRYTKYSNDEKRLIADSIKDYEEFADHLYIHEGIGTIGVEQVRQTVARHKQHTGNTPVVIIDYIQILAPYDIRATDKQNTDSAVLELKRLSRDYKTPVIGISSFNRENYKKPVTMASFKESGAIEYSSDVLIGLQFTKQREVDEHNKNKKANEPAQVIDADEEKAKDPRKIELKILKQRNGETGGSVDFDYHPKFNYFVEKGEARKVSTEKNKRMTF